MDPEDLPSYPGFRFYHTDHACLSFQSHTSHYKFWDSLSWNTELTLRLTQLNCRSDSNSKIRYTAGYTLHGLQLEMDFWSKDNAKIMKVSTEQDKNQPRLSLMSGQIWQSIPAYTPTIQCYSATYSPLPHWLLVLYHAINTMTRGP